jgi:putative sporulation protein YtaF
MLLNSLILAISASIDSFGVGISYGIKKTKIKPSSFLVLFLLSIVVTSISILLGNIIISIISKEFITILGALFLFLIGLFIIIGATRNKKNISKSCLKKEKQCFKQYSFFIKFLGITINIIKDPKYSDIDNSNVIDIKEALFLGIALSLDSISIGFGASIIGINPFIFSLLISLFQILFIKVGITVGRKVNNISKLPKNIWNIISGILLIFIGIIKMLSI